jgi:hypothetical protein
MKRCLAPTRHLHYAVVQMKSDVYSWRLSCELKSSLELEARRRGKKLAGLLEDISRDFLERVSNDVAREDASIRRAAMRVIGAIAGGKPRRAEQANSELRRRLKLRHARS